MNGLVRHADGLERCWWCGTDPQYVRYHDTEWGRRTTDDVRLFEKICLEGFQAGLSWLTILRKREAFREVFAGFDPAQVAAFGTRDVERLVTDVRIVRHRGKIESAINNARRAISLQDEFGSLANYFDGWTPSADTRPVAITRAYLGATPATETSRALSRDLRRRGWTFVGPTTLYAFMQATGLVDDHLEGCAFRTATQRSMS